MEAGRATTLPFSTFIGIDYSGAGLPSRGLRGLRIFQSTPSRLGREVFDERHAQGRWSRNRVREWLLTQAADKGPVLVGLDHAFSLPATRLRQQSIVSWDHLLVQFEGIVATQRRKVSEARADRRTAGLLDRPEGLDPEDWFRLSERRTQQASSVLDFRPRRVAFSTMAGIAQLAALRREAARASAKLHFWPFDGFNIPAGFSAIVEIYPAILKRRFASVDGDTADQRDARCAADWLRAIVRDGHLATYLRPPLTQRQRTQALLEGWILGVM